MRITVILLTALLAACGGGGDEYRTYTQAEASDHARDYCSDKRGFVDADFRTDMRPPRAFFLCGDGSTMSVELSN